MESDQEAYHLKKTRKYKIRFKENVLLPSTQTGHKIHTKMITMIGNLEIPAAWWFVCLCTAIYCESTPYCDLCCSYGTGQAQKCDHDLFLQSLKHGRHSTGRKLKPKKKTEILSLLMKQEKRQLIMENKTIERKTLSCTPLEKWATTSLGQLTRLPGWKTSDKWPRELPYFCQYGQFL